MNKNKKKNKKRAKSGKNTNFVNEKKLLKMIYQLINLIIIKKTHKLIKKL